MLPTKEDMETIVKMLGITVLMPTIVVVGILALIFGWSFGWMLLVTALVFVGVVVVGSASIASVEFFGNLFREARRKSERTRGKA